MRDPSIVIQSRVISALMLRDVKTRFGGNPANYAIAIAWPIAHLVLLLTVYQFVGRLAPYGTSPAQFFAAGVLPYIVFQYPSRFAMFALLVNAPLLGFPIVTLLDILLARIFLEMISSMSVVIIVALGLLAFDVDIVPREPEQAIACLGATLLLAMGMGLVNGLLVKKLPQWIIGYVLVQLPLYITSGIIFLPDALPKWAMDALALNPVTHAVAWFRSTYYPGYGALYLSKTYLVMFGLTLFAGGLVAERTLRRWLQVS